MPFYLSSIFPCHSIVNDSKAYCASALPPSLFTITITCESCHRENTTIHRGFGGSSSIGRSQMGSAFNKRRPHVWPSFNNYSINGRCVAFHMPNMLFLNFWWNMHSKLPQMIWHQMCARISSNQMWKIWMRRMACCKPAISNLCLPFLWNFSGKMFEHYHQPHCGCWPSTTVSSELADSEAQCISNVTKKIVFLKMLSTSTSYEGRSP